MTYPAVAGELRGNVRTSVTPHPVDSLHDRVTAPKTAEPTDCSIRVTGTVLGDHEDFADVSRRHGL